MDLSAESLQAGMSLRSRGKLVLASHESTNSGKKKSTSNLVDANSELLDLHFAPPLPVTKEQLMKELLHDATRSVF